jgi:glycosyltransferase involved in cell wall biosynthesis
MKASVVVCTHNRRAIVARTVRTLFEQDHPSANYEIIVVVDGSSDGSAEMLRSLQPACSYRVIEQQNAGPARARNVGLQAAENDLIIFLDDDMLCDPNLVREHCAAHESQEQAIGFGSIFISRDSALTLAAECFTREIGAYYLAHIRDPSCASSLPPLVFSNTSAPRRMLVQFGGFDERYRMREDAEFGMRLYAAGASARYIPAATAFQIYTKTDTDLLRDAEEFAVADHLLLREHPECAAGRSPVRIAAETGWKKSLYIAAAKMPWLANCALIPATSLGNAFPQIAVLRNPGVRALQARRRIRWHRKMLELANSANPG